MRIGLTYDLRREYLAAGFGEDETAEFDRADTIEHLEAALRQDGHQTDRIGHAQQLVERLAAGEDWDLVFNIAEGLAGVAREAQVPAILDAYGIAYTFSDPLVMALTLHKGLTKTVVAAGGVPTPDFAVVESVADLQAIELPWPLFVKPVAEGTGKGVSPASRVVDSGELRSTCESLLEKHSQPVLVETYLPGREFTVGILGTGAAASALGTLEIILTPGAEAGAYSYVNKERCEELVEYRLVHATDDRVIEQTEAIALRAWRLLGCRDAGRVDLRCDFAGQPQFMEVNPLAGLHPEHSDFPILATKVGLSYSDLIGHIVHSAAERVAIAKQSKPHRFRLSRAPSEFRSR